jgi:uncharacterized protein (TIGR02301 family)
MLGAAHLTIMFDPIPMLRTPIIASFCLCLTVTSALAQGGFWEQQQQPQPQYRQQPFQGQPQPQPKPIQPAAQPQAPTQPPPQNTPAPYDRDLQRLAEILGSLHFLRGICGPNEGQKWRNEAQTLIDTEAPAGERRDQMIASFNRGYRAFQQSYRTCTPAADFAIRRYLAEGAKIAREITARYAN